MASWRFQKSAGARWLDPWCSSRARLASTGGSLAVKTNLYAKSHQGVVLGFEKIDKLRTEARVTRHVSSGLFGSFENRRRYSTNVVKGAVSSAKAKSFKSQRLHIEWTPDLPLPVLDKFRGDNPISERIIYIWENYRQTHKEYHNKKQLRKWLGTSVFPDYDLTIVGSSASGFGFIESDVDMCMQSKQKALPLTSDKQETLDMLKRRLKGERAVTQVCLIPAIVPLIKFAYKRDRQRRMMVEINLDHAVGIVNTQLLFAYSRMDCRVAPLVLAAKRWASAMQIKCAQYGTMSSYTLTLIVLYFLQVQGVVPVLHHEVPEFAKGCGFPEGKPLVLPRWKSENELTLGELFREMVHFYATFDFENHCICIRDGTLISKEEAEERDPGLGFMNQRKNLTNSGTWWNYMMVQEPFNLTNVARAVHSKRNYDEIKSVFERTRQVIDRPGGPKVLLS